MNLSQYVSLPAHKYTYCERRKAFVPRSQVVKEHAYIALSVFLVFAIAIALRLLNLSGVADTTPDQRLNTLHYWSTQLTPDEQLLSVVGIGSTDVEYRARAEAWREESNRPDPDPSQSSMSDNHALSNVPEPAQPVRLTREQRAANLIHARYKVDMSEAEVISRAVYQNAKELNLDPNLLFGLILSESTFRSNEVSTAGAFGLMQVIPRYHMTLVMQAKELFGLSTNLFTPEVNIWVGARVKKQYLQKYGGNIETALLQYNGSMGDPTKAYANKVLSRARIFEKELQ